MSETETKTAIKVIDTTRISFHGYEAEEFDTLREAFEHVARELVDRTGERFEISIPGTDQTIEVDARHVDLSGIDE